MSGGSRAGTGSLCRDRTSYRDMQSISCVAFAASVIQPVFIRWRSCLANPQLRTNCKIIFPGKPFLVIPTAQTSSSPGPPNALHPRFCRLGHQTHSDDIFELLCVIASIEGHSNLNQPPPAPVDSRRNQHSPSIGLARATMATTSVHSFSLKVHPRRNFG